MKSNSRYSYTQLYRSFSILLLLGALLSVSVFVQSAWAIQASPHAFVAEQPDGTKSTLYIRGDEYLSWCEDTNGYTVLHDGGKYVYAELDSGGRLVPTNLVVGQSDPKAAGLSRKILPWPAVSREIRSAAEFQQTDSEPSRVPVAPLGTIKNLVILIRFSNHTGRTLPSNSDIDILFNSVGGDSNLAPTGSVRDVYLENSYGQMTLDSTVVGWIDVPNTEQYYANGVSGDSTLWKALKTALNAADVSIDFSEFDENNDGFIDSIAFLHSGYGAEWGGTDEDGTHYLDRIWSHRWSIAPSWLSDERVRVSDYHISPALWETSGNDIGHIGVICHETGHFFGLPDLYDTDGGGEGIGSWGMMANSWGFDFSQLHPPHFCAWSKLELGWTNATVISPGNYNILQAETNAAVYRIDQGYPAGEYLLIENRQPAGIETDIPQGGLCIFHIDDSAGYNTEGYPGQSGWPENGNHYRIGLLGADGDYDLEQNINRGDAGDVYHGGGVSMISPDSVPNTDAYQKGIISVTGNVISEISVADSNMSFVFSLRDMIVSPSEDFFASGPPGGEFSPNSKTYTLTNNGEQPFIWTATANEDWLDIIPLGGTLSSSNSVSVEVSLNANANDLSIGNYTNTVTFTNLSSMEEQSRDVLLDVIDTIYSTNMDSNPGWLLDSGTGTSRWAWGTPTGGGGTAHGNPDPTSGYTGSNVVGHSLSGDYRNNMNNTQWARTPAIDCSDYRSITLKFYRWLNVEQPSFDHAYIEVSDNGSSWNRIWENTQEITDSSWQLQTFNVSSVANGQPTVFVRWGMGPTDGSWRYSGWNIDDVRMTGVIPGDFQPDGYVDLYDFSILGSAWRSSRGDHNWNPICDISLPADDIIDAQDLKFLAENWLEGIQP